MASAAAESSRTTRARKPNQVVATDSSTPTNNTSITNGYHHPDDNRRPNSRLENGHNNGGSADAGTMNGKHSHTPTHKDKDHHTSHLTDDRLEFIHYFVMALLAYISYATYPPGSLSITQAQGGMTLLHVWYYGWITALSTGLGTLPFALFHDMNKWWLGISNACAAGMMLAASTSLVYEGIILDDTAYVLKHGACIIPQSVRVLLGLLGGLLFIVSTKKLLDQHEEIKVAGLDGLEARKVLLLIFVMTLHSFTEGVGIGVSFGGDKGAQLGVFISLTLAVHNVPEGLAVALVLVPKGVNKWKTALWSIFTSIPQPLMAVPAYLFVESFIPFLPVGLGFAAGAMLWVAVFELVADAVEDTGSVRTTVCVGAVAYACMMALQFCIKEEV